jgi:hypothetical protein
MHERKNKIKIFDILILPHADFKTQFNELILTAMKNPKPNFIQLSQ